MDRKINKLIHSKEKNIQQALAKLQDATPQQQGKLLKSLDISLTTLTPANRKEKILEIIRRFQRRNLSDTTKIFKKLKTLKTKIYKNPTIENIDYWNYLVDQFNDTNFTDKEFNKAQLWTDKLPYAIEEEIIEVSDNEIEVDFIATISYTSAFQPPGTRQYSGTVRIRPGQNLEEAIVHDFNDETPSAGLVANGASGISTATYIGDVPVTNMPDIGDELYSRYNIQYGNMVDIPVPTDSNGNPTNYGCVLNFLIHYAKNPKNRLKSYTIIQFMELLKKITGDIRYISEGVKLEHIYAAMVELKKPIRIWIPENGNITLKYENPCTDKRSETINIFGVNNHIYLCSSTIKANENEITDMKIEREDEETLLPKNTIYLKQDEMNTLFNEKLAQKVVLTSSKTGFLGPRTNCTGQPIEFQIGEQTYATERENFDNILEIMSEVNTQKYYSILNETLRKDIELYRLPPIKRQYLPTMGTNQLDSTLNYTRALYNLENIYVFNSLCDWELPQNYNSKFKNGNPRGGLQEGFYLVETTDFTKYNGSGLYTSEFIARYPEIEITLKRFLKPAYIMPNPFKKIIDRLFTQDMTPEDRKKNKIIINTITGILEKRRNVYYNSKYFTSENDAIRYRQNGRYSEIKKSDGYFMVIKKTIKEFLSTGFMIKQQIYNESHVIVNELRDFLFKRYREITITKRTIDSFSYILPPSPGKEKKENMLKKEDLPKIKVGNLITEAYKIEEPSKIIGKTLFSEVTKSIPSYQPPEPVPVQYFDTTIGQKQEILDIIFSNSVTFLDARFMAGKTKVIINGCIEKLERERESYAICAPYHSMLLNYADNARKPQTIFSLLKINPFSSTNGMENTKDLNYIIIDEVAKLSIMEACGILSYQTIHPNTKFICCGSLLQNPGLESKGGELRGVQIFDFPVWNRFFTARIGIKHGFSIELENRVDLIKRTRDYPIVPLELNTNKQYITRSTAMKDNLNLMLAKLEIGFPLSLRLKNIILRYGTKIFITSSKLAKKYSFFKQERLEIIGDSLSDNLDFQLKLRSLIRPGVTADIPFKELVSEKIVENPISLERTKKIIVNMDFAYALTINLSQSLRISDYVIVLSSENSLRKMNDTEIEVAFSRSPDYVCSIFPLSSPLGEKVISSI